MGAKMSELDWLPLTCVIIYMVAAPLGLCSIPFMYVGEIFFCYFCKLFAKRGPHFCNSAHFTVYLQSY